MRKNIYQILDRLFEKERIYQMLDIYFEKVPQEEDINFLEKSNLSKYLHFVIKNSTSKTLDVHSRSLYPPDPTGRNGFISSFEGKRGIFRRKILLVAPLYRNLAFGSRYKIGLQVARNPVRMDRMETLVEGTNQNADMDSGNPGIKDLGVMVDEETPWILKYRLKRDFGKLKKKG